MKFSKLLVIIPTRNRADFAIRAINSVLGREAANCHLIVSDNSTDEHESETLSSFCAELHDSRLKYIRPEEPLPMTQHWDWAMTQAFLLTSFSHVLYLTDRMLFLRGGLGKLVTILMNYPDSAVAYNADDIDDSTSPVLLFQQLRTGKVFEIDSCRMLERFAGAEIIRALPRMLNCVAPSKLMCLIKQRTGSYFSSVSPDYNFAFECLNAVDSFLYYDDTILLGYGRDRSNGTNMLKGTFQKDTIDFVKNLDSTNVCFETPVKTIFVRTNAVLHEYAFVKESTSATGKFPEIDPRNYLKSLVLDVVSYGNPEMKKEMWDKLASAVGWRLHFYAIYSRTLLRVEGLKVRLYNLFNPSFPHTKITLFPGIHEAIEHANNCPRETNQDFRFLHQRIGQAPAEKTFWRKSDIQR